MDVSICTSITVPHEQTRAYVNVTPDRDLVHFEVERQVLQIADCR